MVKARNLPDGFWKWFALALSFFLVLFYTISAGIAPVAPQYHRGVYVLITFVLVFIFFPARKKGKRNSDPTIADVLFLSLALVSIIYWMVEYPSLNERAGAENNLDFLISGFGILLALEVARRVLGRSLVFIAIAMLLYAYFGRYMPEAIEHGGFSVKEIAIAMFISINGIFGIMANVLATYVILFIFFGAFLKQCGTTDFLIRLATTLAGKRIGGPAKVAVIASAFFGSISGSAIANTVSTGVFTIPMMKKAGFRPHVAGAIEPSASIAGMFLPPVMGAGGFLMAEFTELPYSKIMMVSLFPAIFYILGVFTMVHLEAKKHKIRGAAETNIPPVRKLLEQEWYMALPIIIITWLMIRGFSPGNAAFWGIIGAILLGLIRRDTTRAHYFLLWPLYLIPLKIFIELFFYFFAELRAGATFLNPVVDLHPGYIITFVIALVIFLLFLQKRTVPELLKTFVSIAGDSWHAAVTGAGQTLVIGATVGVIGIIVGTIELTGIGLQLSSIIISLATSIGDSEFIKFLADGFTLNPTAAIHAMKIFLTLLFIALASLVLGMGVPVTAAYMITIVLVAPALTGLGISLLAAHMIVYWLSQDSNITPPVCIAAYAGAAIAGANPWKTGWTAFKFAKMLYVMPVLFAFIPSMLLDGSPENITITFISCALGTIAFSALSMFYFVSSTTWYEWIFLLGTTLLLFWPTMETTALGMLFLLGLYFFQRFRGRKSRP